MKKLLAILLLLIPVMVCAEPVARSPDGSAVVTVHLKQSCDIPELAKMFKEATGQDSRAATVVLDNVENKACFIVEEEEGMVVVITEDGRGGFVPMEVFNEETAI